MKNQTFAVIVIAIALFLTGVLSVIHHYEKELKSAAKKYDYATQEALIYTNKYNESVIEVKALEGNKKDLKKEVERWKNSGDTLRSKITGLTKQVTLLKQELNINIKGKTIVTPGDTIKKDSLIYVYPSYMIDSVNKWFGIKAFVNHRNYTLDFSIKDLDTEIVSEYEAKRLLGIRVGKGALKVTAISKNPYVLNKDLKTITIEDKKNNNFLKGVIVGLGAFLVVKSL